MAQSRRAGITTLMLAHQIFDALASGQRITALTVIERSKVCAQRLISKKMYSSPSGNCPAAGVSIGKGFRSWPDKPYLDKMLGRRAMVCHFSHPAWGCVVTLELVNQLQTKRMTAYLLDVNVLLALSDPMHIHHEAAHRWFAAGVNPQATCPITENGLVPDRQPSQLPESSRDVPAVLAILRQFCATAGHHFWSEDVSIRKLLQPVRCSSFQITDVFLLGLAIHRVVSYIRSADFYRCCSGRWRSTELIAP